MRECIRVIGNRRLILVLLLLLLCNVWLYIRQETQYQIYDPSDYSSRYQAMVKECGQGEPEEVLLKLNEQLNLASDVSLAYDMLEWKESNPSLYEIFLTGREEDTSFLEMLETENFPYSKEEAALQAAVCQQMIEQVQYFIEYPQYLQKVKENAEQMQKVSLFSDPDSFSYKNIQKTVADFSHMDGAVLSLGEDQAVTSLFQDKLLDYSIVLFQLLVCAMLLEERKKGLWSIIHAASGGRAPLACKRIFLLFLTSLLSCGVLLGGKMAAASYLYGGFGDPARLIQSIEMFRGVPVPTTLYEFFIQYFLIKTAGTFLLGLCFWLVLSSIANTSLAFAGGGLFLAAQYAMFTLIKDSYLLVPLRYINVFAYVEYQPIYSKYLNISIFGLVVNARALTLGLLPVLLVLAGGAAVLVQVKKKPVTSKNRLEKLLDRFRLLVNPLCRRFGLFSMELYKVLWIQKGLFLLLLLAVLQFFYTSAPFLYQSEADLVKNHYASQMEGPAGEATLSYILAEEEDIDARLEDISVEMAASSENAMTYQFEAQSLAGQKQALESIREETNRLLTLKEERNIDGWLLDPSFYLSLFHPDTSDYRQETALKAVLILVLTLSGIFAYENQQGTAFMLKACEKGRTGLFLRKGICGFVLAAVIGGLVYGREIYLAAKLYGGIPALSAPVQSVSLFQDFPFSISLGVFLLLFYSMRLLTLWALTGLIFLLSTFFHRLDHAVVAQIALWLLPAGLSVMGVASISRFTFLAPLCASEFFLSGSLWVYGLMAGFLLLGTVLSWYRWKKPVS